MVSPIPPRAAGAGADAAAQNGRLPRNQPAWTETDRLITLERYAILDTPPEPPFDALVELAAEICETPIALLTLVTKDRQWFKAVKGLDFRETPLNASICAQLLRMPGVTIVPDLTADSRFACNPLVSAAPELRFYAGAVLETPERMPLGSLCVLDQTPRPSGLTERQTHGLATLAAQAMDSLELRRLHAEQSAARLRDREASKRRERVVLASLSDGVFALDRNLRFTLFNKAAEAFTGRSAEQVLGQPLSVLFPPGGNELEERVREVASTGKALTFEAASITRPGHYVQMRLAPMNGGVAGSFTDITQEKRAHAAQQTLIAELQHRTRNLLAVVRSMAQQTIYASGSLTAFRVKFNSRLAALGRVQSLLSRGDERIDLCELVRTELTAHGVEPDGERWQVAGPIVPLSSEAVQSLALALHELTTNAAKYGAIAQVRGRLAVTWTVEDGTEPRVVLCWTESGVDMPPAQQRVSGFGRKLIEKALPHDLGADTSFAFAADGVRCRIAVPLNMGGHR